MGGNRGPQQGRETRTRFKRAGQRCWEAKQGREAPLGAQSSVLPACPARALARAAASTLRHVSNSPAGSRSSLSSTSKQYKCSRVRYCRRLQQQPAGGGGRRGCRGEGLSGGAAAGQRGGGEERRGGGGGARRADGRLCVHNIRCASAPRTTPSSPPNDPTQPRKHPRTPPPSSCLIPPPLHLHQAGLGGASRAGTGSGAAPRRAYRCPTPGPATPAGCAAAHPPAAAQRCCAAGGARRQSCTGGRGHEGGGLNGRRWEAGRRGRHAEASAGKPRRAGRYLSRAPTHRCVSASACRATTHARSCSSVAASGAR